MEVKSGVDSDVTALVIDAIQKNTAGFTYDIWHADTGRYRRASRTSP